MSTLRDVLRYLVTDTSNDARPPSQRAADDKDDFEPIRASSLQRSTESLKHRDDELHLCHVLHVCVGFLTVGPFLQSGGGEPTRDKELMSFLLSAADKNPENFLVVFPLLLTKIRQRVLYLGEKTLNVLLDELEKLLQLYSFSRSGRLQYLAIRVLHSTIDLWSTPSISASEVGGKIRALCDWLSGALRKKKINSWSTRDALSVFLDKYLKHDPEQLAWSIAEDNEDDEERVERLGGLPTALLMLMNSDEDIRVRFRSASVVGGLFSAARRVSYDPMLVYGDLRRHFTNNLDKCVYLCSITHSF